MSLGIQIRYKLNTHDTGNGDAAMPTGDLWGPWREDPELDFRDDQTVWVWLYDDLCIELTRDLAEHICKEFKEQ